MASDGNFKNKIIKVFGMDVDEEGNAEEYIDDDGQEGMTGAADAEEGTARRSSATRGHSAMGGLAGGPEVLVLDPEFFNDAPGIVNKIKENKTVVVNLKNTEYEDGRKIFDFLNGAVFALEGSINKIADNVFILAPKQVSVSTEMEKEEDEYITPILDWDAE